ncbi:hypothetical protein LO763_20090 [Glycomyces sp. A-F 0318]|uniref:hypothetical protein n=1 Tax=Glycomyces amatae TaxID=2881355 RepID=UPI001E6126E0|nr:hypothetical protein [Glycomyces amatae]MCD0445915.1 hypothetical protein [Glycomyces amatae]
MTRVLVLLVHGLDADTDPVRFNTVLDVLTDHAAHLEVLGPAAAALRLPGHGDEAALAETILDAVSGLTGADADIGIADTLLAATLAAADGRIVPPGGDTAFLAPRPLTDLVRTGLLAEQTAVTLHRLGIDTVGAFVDLEPAAVAERFGAAVRRAQALAATERERPLIPRAPSEDLAVHTEPDEPFGSVEQAAFAARPLAERLLSALAERNLACTRVTITAHAASGLTRMRTWAVDADTNAAGLARRVRWQLDGWLAAGGTDAISRLELAPAGVMGLLEAGRGLWESKNPALVQAERALRHAETLLGPGTVVRAQDAGGRDLIERLRLLPWDAVDRPEARGPWPGALVGPPPVLVDAEPVAVTDAAGAPVVCGARGTVSAAPAFLAPARGGRVPITAWAGPWPVTERWWGPGSRRYTRLQVVLADARAALLVCEDQQWTVAGWYG